MRRYAAAVAVVLCSGLVLSGCGQQNLSARDGTVIFVHATDPHFFLPADPNDKNNTARDKQQDADSKAVVDMFQELSLRAEDNGPFAFLLLTGDLGIEPCPIAKDDKDCVHSADPALRDAQIAKLAKIFDQSPISEIYLVAGNNDVEHESPAGAALDYFNTFIDDLQKLLSQSGHVQLHNLTHCYADNSPDLASCYADLHNTSYRLIGFPSYSFKNTRVDNSSVQAQQFNTFRKLLDQSRSATKQALIVSHIPDMDDPYFLAQYRFDSKSRERPKVDDSTNAEWFTWNVSKQLLDDWHSAVSSDTVSAVFAGHLHDPHRDIYRRPYTWTDPGSPRQFQKLFLAPPLAVKNQDTSPIQARGFSIVRLGPSSIGTRLYWYDSEKGTFARDELPGSWRGRPIGAFPRHISAIFLWLWNLDSTDSPLSRAAVLSIALLTAFLTIIAIWQIPPAKNPLAPPPKNGNADSLNPAPDPSPFTSRFGKTVIAGLGGLVAAEVTKTLGNQQSTPDSRWFYIVWFIALFFTLLVLLNLWRAATESLRAHVAVSYYPLARPSNIGPVSYWSLRFTHWLLSWRVPALTFADTFVNLIQGKNQTVTNAIADQVIEQQANIVRVADSIRMNLTALVENALGARSHVRINISVLSADQSSAFYISQTSGSAKQVFLNKSVAWVSIFTGQLRWYKTSWKPKLDTIVLFDNTSGAIPSTDKKKLMLCDYYQPRPGEDYEAFLVFPVPYPQRGYGSDYVKGAIHLSFHDEADFGKIFDLPDPNPEYPPKALEIAALCIKSPEVGGALRSAIASLGELLRGFNEVVYESYIEPNPAQHRIS